MIKQVITVNHKKYATGLFWQPVSVGNTPYNYARQLARTVNNKRYSLYVDYKSMVGLGATRDGARFGMPSAAAEIVDSLSEFVSFLGVFVANKHYYLLAVRNGVVIYDFLIETEQEARKKYTELSGIPDWGALFAPASWGMPKSQEKFLYEIISGKVNAKLRQISMVKSLIPSVFFISLFVLGGVYLLRSPLMDMLIPKKTVQLDPELAAEYKRQIEIKNQELDEQFEIVKKEPEPIVLPYDNLPDVMERANLCYKAIGFVMQPVVGWNQKYAKCDEEYVTANFVRDFGTLNDFYDVGAELMPGAVVQQVSEDEIIVRVKLPKLETFSSLDRRDQADAMRDIVTNFQKINTRVNIEGIKDTLTNGEESVDLNVIEVGVTSKLVPSELMHAFYDFGGVYMTAVSWNVNTRVWNYEIIVYTK